MVLTRSRTTTMNDQGNEQRTTALERQVQTLVAAVKRLTKHNNDLEERLRQKDTTIDDQGEDREADSAEERNRGGPEGSNALSQHEGHETSHPSETSYTPSSVAAEM